MKIFRKVLLWIFVGLISLGQLQRIEFNQFNIAIYLHDIFIILWLVQVLLTSPISFIKYLINFFKQDKKLKLLLSLSIFSLAINFFQSSDLISLIYFARLLTYIIFGFSLSFLVKNNKIEAEYLKFQVFSIGLLSLLLGFIQFIFIKDTRFLSILGWDDHYARLISTFFDPGFTGIIFLLTLLIGMSSKYLQNKKVQLLILISFLWGITLTFSRASYLATIISFLIIAVSQISLNKDLIKKLFLGSMVFALLVILAPKPWGEGVNLFRTSTIKARYESIYKQLSIFSPQTILIGNGPFSQKNSLNYNSPNQSDFNLPSHSRVPDNIFINVLLSIGVFGLILFIKQLIKWARSLKKKDIFLFAGFIGLLVHTQFNSSLIQPFVLLILLSGIASYKK